jgi:thymidylate kinase
MSFFVDIVFLLTFTLQQYALKMQLYLLRRRYKVYLTAISHIVATGEGAVLDRSIFSDWVFAEKNRLDGNISSEGFWYYTQLREKMLQRLPFPHTTVYLDVDPQECFTRIHGLRKRYVTFSFLGVVFAASHALGWFSRSAAEVDSGIPLEYLQGLDRCYQQFLEEMNSKGSNVLKVDWSKFGDLSTIKDQVLKSHDLPSAEWDRPYLLDIVNSPQLIKSR